MKTALRFPLALLVSATLANAQVPDGHYVYSAFSPARGPIGVFTSHPRNPGSPTAIQNLQGDLTVTGGSAILYRQTDGAIFVGERSPTDSSVDVHVIKLNGTSVLFDASFSVGTGGTCCGEIPQMAFLSDDEVVVAATDLSAGPLKQWLTTSYGWQGIGIVNVRSGLITPIPVTNGASIVDVFNGLALSPDKSTIYVGTYVTATQGDIWAIPIGGGTATLVATVPAGLSNLAFDDDGSLLVCTLRAAQAFFRVDVSAGTFVQIPQTNGTLNAIALEEWTGNYAVASANSGIPARSVFWMEPDGTDHLLTNAALGSVSGIAIHPDPEIIGPGTPGSATYDWVRPNPGGLPLSGNTGFSLSLESSSFFGPGAMVFALGRAATPIDVLGLALHLDPVTLLTSVVLPSGTNPTTLPLPISADSSLIGGKLFVQSIHIDGPTTLATSPGLSLTIL